MRGQNAVDKQAIHVQPKERHVGKGALRFLHREEVGIQHEAHRGLFTVGEDLAQVTNLLE